MPDFGLLQTPNFAQALLSGLSAGRAMGQQKRLDGALSAVDLSRPETIMGVLQADPQTGAALLGASAKMAEAQHETAGRVALTNYIKDRLSKGGGQAISSAGGSGVTGPSPSSALPAQDGDIVVTAKPHGPDAERGLIEADPEKYLSVQANFEKLDENHRKAINDAADAQATVAQAAAAMPYEQRKAYIQSQASYLTAHGVTEDQIAAFDPTDGAIQAQVSQALGVKGILERADKDRTFGLQEKRFEHDVSHDAATLGVSQGNLAVSQGNLSLARQREGRVAAGGGKSAGGASAAAPVNTSHYEYRIVNGVTQKRLVK